MDTAPLYVNTSGEYNEYNVPYATSSALALAIGIVVVKFSILLCFFLATVGGNKVRQDAGRWPQRLTALAMIMMEITYVISVHTHLIPVPRSCHVIQPLLFVLGIIIMWGIILTVIDRILSVKQEPEDSKEVAGFTHRAILTLLLCVVLITIILTTGLVFGAGGGTALRVEGIYFCSVTGSDVSGFQLRYIFILMHIITLSITVYLIILLYRRREGYISPAPSRVIPVITASLVLCVAYVVESLGWYGLLCCVSWYCKDMPVSYVLVILIWLAGDKELRYVIVNAVCSCCPANRDHSEHAELLGNQAGKISKDFQTIHMDAKHKIKSTERKD